MVIPAGERRMVPLGFKMEMPENRFGSVYALSSSVVKGVGIAAGVFDAQYRGNMGLVVINDSKDDLHITRGSTLGQLVVHNGPRPELKEVMELSQRGTMTVTPVQEQAPATSKEHLHMMKRGLRWFPTKRGPVIQIPCNRSFLLKPGHSHDLWMPIVASKDVVLQPLFFNNLRVETGFIPQGQYFRCRVFNKSPDIMHITEKQCFVCFEHRGLEWGVKGAHNEARFLGHK